MANNFPLNGIINILYVYLLKTDGTEIPVNPLLYSEVGTPRPSPLSLRLEGLYNDENTLIGAEFVIADGGDGDGLKSETQTS